MTTYYVRQSVGNDSSAGTSAGAAWATVGKALGASGMSSGDTVYIGAGIYREAVSVGFTPSGATNIIGDVDGAQTGDAGEVRLSGYTTGDILTASTTPLACNSKPFLAFSNLVVHAAGASTVISNIVHDTSFTNCAMYGINNGGGMVTVVPTVDAASNIVFDRCRMLGVGVNSTLLVTLPTSTVADYDSGVYVRNCLIVCATSNSSISVSASGANTFKGGGVHVRNCTLIGQFGTASANVSSTTFPCTIYNSIVQGTNTNSVNATTSGQIVEDYNVLISNTPRSNVAIGTHSQAGQNIAFLPSFGQETVWGGVVRPFGTPVGNLQSILGWGQQAASGNDTQPTVDLLNRSRPGGVGQLVASGTATSATVTTLTNTNATLGTNSFVGATIKITGGTASGQLKTIKSHTATVVTVYGNWTTTPDNTSTYSIYWGTPAEHFQCTSGSTTTAVQSSASWIANMWTGFTVNVVSGTGNGQTTLVSSNSATTLNLVTLSTGLDSTSVVKLYRQTDENTVSPSAGASERHDTGKKEVTLTDAGGVAVALFGWADQDILVPVDTSATTITVKCSFDTDHGNTNKPQASIVADAEIGVTASTQTCTGTAGSGTFETLTFPAQTATARGAVRVRLQSRSDKPTGRAVFDTISVT